MFSVRTLRTVSVPKQPQPKAVQKIPVKHVGVSPLRALPNVEVMSYFAGKSIILFTMFYCSMNWLHYRNLRKSYEDNDMEDDRKKDKK